MDFRFIIKSSNDSESINAMQAITSNFAADYIVSIKDTDILAKIDDITGKCYYQVIYEFIRK